ASEAVLGQVIHGACNASQANETGERANRKRPSTRHHQAPSTSTVGAVTPAGLVTPNRILVGDFSSGAVRISTTPPAKRVTPPMTATLPIVVACLASSWSERAVSVQFGSQCSRASSCLERPCFQKYPPIPATTTPPQP